MIKNTFEFIQEKNFYYKITFLLFAIFPIGFLTGNFVINSLIILLSFSFLFKSLVEKNFYFAKSIFFWALLLFWLSLLINLFFSLDHNLSQLRVIKFFFIIIFIFSLANFINERKFIFESKVISIWLVIYVIVIFDLCFEYILGYNILGFTSIIPGRLSSFMGDELVIGYFFSGFSLLSLTFLYYKKISNTYLLVISIFLIFVSLLIGERSNFIRTFLMICAFLFIVDSISIKKKILSLVVLIISLIVFVNFNDNYKKRFYDQITHYGIKNYYYNSIYGVHYDTAYQMFKENKIFGVGIKNFRAESKKYNGTNNKYRFDLNRSTTHPHQLHFELLSETGIFGYFYFILFMIFSIYLSIKNFVENKNYFQLSSIIFILTSLIPFLPSGSFFTTYSSSLFWLHYAIMIGYNQKS